jgi:hypothetical protein
MTGFTTNDFLSRNRVSLKEAFEGLEHSSLVRGLDGSNPSGYSVTVPTVADLRYRCPCGVVS